MPTIISQAKPSQAKPSQAKPSQAKPSQAKPSQCHHCYPEIVDHHQERLNSFYLAYIQKPFEWLFKFLTFNKPLYFTDRYLIASVILLQKFNKIQRHNTIKPEKTVPRFLLLWNEAKKRGLNLYSFTMGHYQLMTFLLVYRGKNYYFHYSPALILHKNCKSFKDPTTYDDKYLFKKILKQHDLPYAAGKFFFSKRHALEYGKKLGFPLVVKPRFSTLSHHISINIQNKFHLKKAIEVAKIIDSCVVIERFIPGDSYRMMCVGEDFLFCFKRKRAMVMGDGISTIDSLIDKLNSHPLRSDFNQPNAIFYKILKENSPLKDYLEQQGLQFNSVPSKGKRIYLTDKQNTSNGVELISMTKDVHPENIHLFKKLHHLLGIAISAVDFIC